MKKTISVMLSCIITFIPTLTWAKIEFIDVKDTDWFAPAIYFLAENGIMQGDGRDAMPQANIRRADFLILVMRAYNIELINSDDNFADVTGDEYYAGHLATAKKLNLVQGGYEGEFYPNELITRQDMCVMLFNVLSKVDKLPPVGRWVEMPSDVADYASNPMARFVGSGIIQGTENGLDPRGLTTRAQAAQVLYNLMK